MLSINGNILKINSNWLKVTNPHEGLLYLTYFTRSMHYPGTWQDDDPVVRDESIPVIKNGGSSSSRQCNMYTDVIGSGEPQLPESFTGLDYGQFEMIYGASGQSGISWVGDTQSCLWPLPFTSSSKWSMTYRAFFRTTQYVQVQYSNSADVDWYWLNPGVWLLGTSHAFGTGDFDSERYPSKIISTYGTSTSSTEPSGQVLQNETAWGMFEDRTYSTQKIGYKSTYPPFGRRFYAFSNPNVSPIAGDQWYYIVICGHGDGTVGIYVNGTCIMTVPFETISELNFYVGSKTFQGQVMQLHGSGYPLLVTELSLWDRDLSNGLGVVPVKAQPIYKKENGIYVPNELY